MNTETFRLEYEQYVQGFSTEDMAASYEVMLFCIKLCLLFKPLRILDLGSGFSSFVLRYYQKKLARVHTEVWSVDDSRLWLERTQSFLEQRNLSDSNLLTWDEFHRLPMKGFQFIFYDLGRMDVRKQNIDYVLNLTSADGMILFDDVHKPWYGSLVSSKLKERGFREYSLRPYTIDKFGRFSALAVANRKFV